MTNYRLFLFLGLCFICCWNVSAFSENQKQGFHFSDEDLGKGLQDFQDTIERLATSNAQWRTHNAPIKQNVQELQAQLNALDKQSELLDNELDRLKEETKTKKNGIAAIDTKIDEIKDLMADTDQAIAKATIRQESLRQGQAQLWGRLAAAQRSAKGPFKRPNERQTFLNTKEALLKTAEENQGRIDQLKKQLDEESSAPKEPPVSSAQLTVQRDELKAQLAKLVPLPNPEAENGGKEIKKLKAQINVLTKKRLEHLKLLEHAERQYSSGPSSKPLEDEQKIQTSIVQLTKDNQLLKRQNADLRLEMVELDKKKVKMQSVVDSANR